MHLLSMFCIMIVHVIMMGQIVCIELNIRISVFSAIQYIIVQYSTVQYSVPPRSLPEPGPCRESCSSSPQQEETPPLPGSLQVQYSIVKYSTVQYG